MNGMATKTATPTKKATPTKSTPTQSTFTPDATEAGVDHRMRCRNCNRD
jgi:hypothetical protein